MKKVEMKLPKNPPPWRDVRDKIHTTRVNIGFQGRNSWKDAKAVFNKHTLKIQNHPVMEDWETSYMKELAKIACRKGGTILEVGYGMGISARFIQMHKIKKHIIIEANKEVAERARLFAKKARYKTEILEGLWEEVVNLVQNGSVDGILFDTYPLSELEIHKNHFGFFKTAFKKLKKGGIFTYYSDEIKEYHKVHLQSLTTAGFKLKNISYKIVDVNPPKNCQYWKSKTILAPIVIK